MKKIYILAVSMLIAVLGFSQEQNNKTSNSDYGELKGGFKQENIFLGGSFSLGFGSGQFTIGGSPEIGYSFNKWLDAGLGLNIIYTSLANNTFSNPTDEKVRRLNYGGGPFVRIYPVQFLFVQGQFEQNWTKYTEKGTLSTGEPFTQKYNVTASSLIASIGYTQRAIGQGSYYFMIGIDLLKNENSPYVGYGYDGKLYAIPIIKAGFNFYLKPSKQAAREPQYQGNHTL
jgi:hypothetical protein